MTNVLRSLAFNLEIPNRRIFPHTKTQHVVKFTTHRWHNTHMIKLSRKDFRELVRNQVEASLGKRLGFFDRWVITRAEVSARGAMHEKYQKRKKATLRGNVRIKGQKDITRYVVKIERDTGLLCDTKTDLKNKMLNAFEKKVFEKTEEHKGKALTDRAIKIRKNWAADTARKIVSNTYVDIVFNRIRDMELEEHTQAGGNRSSSGSVSTTAWERMRHSLFVDETSVHEVNDLVASKGEQKNLPLRQDSVQGEKRIKSTPSDSSSMYDESQGSLSTAESESVVNANQQVRPDGQITVSYEHKTKQNRQSDDKKSTVSEGSSNTSKGVLNGVKRGANAIDGSTLLYKDFSTDKSVKMHKTSETFPG